MPIESPTQEARDEPCPLGRAMALVSFLRIHCPWDQAQTPRSLIKHLVEESHEVGDAILSGDVEGLKGELGDLLLNLAFQLVIAEEEGQFTRTDVWTSLDHKMRGRHPHLFGLGDEIRWEDAKEREADGAEGVLSGLPATLPPLATATAMGRRASRVGFDWGNARGALAKVHEELAEVGELLAPLEGLDSSAPQRHEAKAPAQEGEDEAVQGTPPNSAVDPEAVEEEIGDLLFAVVNVSRHVGVDAATALARANLKFRARFEAVEALASARGLAMPGTPLDELDRLWEEVKSRRPERDADRQGGPGPQGSATADG